MATPRNSVFLFAPIICLLIGLGALTATDYAYAAPEKGPKCSDGIDNDGDGLIDGDDPDCGADGGSDLEARVADLEAQLESLITLGGLACGTDQVAKWNGSSWVCAPDEDTTDPEWANVQNIPPEIADGDDADTLGALPCGTDQVAKWNGTAWVCASDSHTLLVWKDGLGNVLGQDVANTYWGSNFATIKTDKGFLFHLYPIASSAYESGTYGKQVNEVLYTGANCSGDAFITEAYFEPGTIYNANYDDQKYFSDFLVEPVLVAILTKGNASSCEAWVRSDFYFPLYPNDPAITGVDNVPFMTGPFSREPMN